MAELEKIQGKAEGKPATKRALRGAGAGGLETVDLDVTPVMNLFLVLIPFLVSMAVFTHLAIVEFSLPPGVSDQSEADPTTPDHIDISVVLTDKGYTIMGSGQKLELVPKSGERYDFEALIRQLKAIKYKYPQEESIVLVVEPSVLYEDIIHFMDKCRESQFPNIGLSGGFQ